MKLEVNLKLNETQSIKAEFDAINIQEAVLQAGSLLAYDGQCEKCGDTNVTLQTRVAGEGKYKYTEFVCQGCNAKRQMGEYRDGSGFFLKPWEDVYVKDAAPQQ